MEHREILDQVFLIKDIYNYVCTLVVGSEKALLFDTTCGVENIKKYAETITQKELIVVNSHGHLDHCGGDRYFEQAYMSRADWPLTAAYDRKLPNLPAEIQEIQKSLNVWSEEHLQEICEQDVIDIGNKKFRVIALPAHTPGSIGLYCEEDSLLLSGDALTPNICMFFPESLTGEDYLKTLDKISRLNLKCFTTGHHFRMMDMQILEKYDACARQYLEQKVKGIPFEYSLNPQIKAEVYIYDHDDHDVDDMICYISKVR